MEDLAPGRAAEEAGQGETSVLETIRQRQTGPLTPHRGTQKERWGTGHPRGELSQNWKSLKSTSTGDIGPARGRWDKETPNKTRTDDMPAERYARGATLKKEELGTIRVGQRVGEPDATGMFVAPHREAPTPRANAGIIYLFI